MGFALRPCPPRFSTPPYAGGRGINHLVPRARGLTVVALMGVAAALRLAVDEPGPLFLAPTVFAGLWFGRRVGGLTGLLGGGAYALAALLGPMGNVTAASLAVRTVLFGVVGWLVGRLVEERGLLATEVERRDALLQELRAIQQALTPAGTPPRPGLSIAAVYKPAIEMVAGDFYLVAEGPSPETTVVAVGDVVGKGVEAARRAAFVRTALSVSAPFVDDPGRLLELANRSLVERAGVTADFVTAICVAYDSSRQALAWASAGHMPPLRLGSGSELEGETATPLGIADEFHCPVTRGRLEPGSGLVLFTDGLIEARRDNGSPERFGYERLKRALAQLAGDEPIEVGRRLVAAAESFSRQALEDDICIVTLRALPQAGAN